MASNEPPPKKRRTESAQVTNGSVAQANETLQVFLGQNTRQNRWMQGYVPSTLGDEPRPTLPTQTQQPNGATRAVSGGSHHVQSRNSIAGPIQQSFAASPTMNANLVQYQSPATSTPVLPSNAPAHVSRKSMDRISSGGAPPGLPSPVSSDGAMNSPAAVQESVAPRRGRPPLHTTAAGAGVGTDTSSPANGSPATRMEPPPQHSPQFYSHPPTTSGASSGGNFNPAMYLPSNTGQPLQTTQTMQRPQNPQKQRRQPNQPQPRVWDPQTMLQKLNELEQSTLPTISAKPVDYGRLSLLRDAINRNDFFYICLNQVHCLTSTPSLLPGPAKQLSMQAIGYIEVLICSNNIVSQPVLKWLSEFPAPITAIYASPSRAQYHKLVQEVVEFLQRMPIHWDELVNECRRREAPPLMDDLVTRLALWSPVLQTTVFRAITRMILPESGDVLEPLHRMDQDAFVRGRSKRTASEKEAAYQAFRQTIQQVRWHEETYNNGNSRDAPRFMLRPEVIAHFHVGVPAPTPPPSQTQHTQQHAANNTLPQLQQHNMQSSAQPMQHSRHRSRGSRSSANIAGSPHLLTPFNANMNMNGVSPMPQQLHKPHSRLVYPHENEPPRAQPTQPDPNRSALHQAHLRSPKLSAEKPDSPRLYRYVSHFAARPRKINKDLPVERMFFRVSQDLFESLPTTMSPERHGELSSRKLNEQSYTIRLRCAAATKKNLSSESGWMEADNAWPENLFLQCNGHILEARRKLHHGRYLPIDLTSMMRPGENELTVFINRARNDTRPFEWALAVEAVGVISHTSISDRLTCISAEKSLSSIKRSLSSADDDDDLVITSSTATIALFDPHTLTKIFDVPVRGKACLHKDCFDLETFLSQREPRPRPGSSGVPSVVDCWRCPICRGDVRPHTLVRDGFLDAVRAELERKGELDTRAIVVEADGKWKAKEEDSGGVRSPSLEREERIAAAANNQTKDPKVEMRAVHVPRPKPAVEIIEIDD